LRCLMATRGARPKQVPMTPTGSPASDRQYYALSNRRPTVSERPSEAVLARLRMHARADDDLAACVAEIDALRARVGELSAGLRDALAIIRHIGSSDARKSAMYARLDALLAEKK
jgi:hypothetical protein